MKKKLVSKTYLREAEKYKIKIFLDDDEYFISVKKLIKLSEKFIIKNDIIAMDDGYYIFEVIPKHENYSMRLFLNEKKEPIEYYFDIIKESGLDKDTNIPYYIDLYLDITMLYNGDVNILDEEELNIALKENDITKEEYDIVHEVKNKLLEEIKSNNNKLMKIDYLKYLGDL